MKIKAEMEHTSKKLTVAPYVRVGSDNRAATPKVDLSKLSEEELSAGLYIPTQERFFRNSPDGDLSYAEFVLQDWLRQKDKNKKK